MRTKVPQSSHLSLEGVHSSVEIPDHQAGFWEQWRAFVGPAILVSVGYMDPGNSLSAPVHMFGRVFSRQPLPGGGSICEAMRGDLFV